MDAAKAFSGRQYAERANINKFYHLRGLVRGGLFMYYDSGYEGFGRAENGKLAMLTSRKKVTTYDYPYVIVRDYRLLTAEHRDYFISKLLHRLRLDYWFYLRERPSSENPNPMSDDSISEELLAIDPMSWPTGELQVELALYQELVESRD